MDLKADLWFPQFVFAGYLENVDRNTLKTIAKEWQAKEPNLAGNSNAGGWHSRSIENVDLVDPAYVSVLRNFVRQSDLAVEYVAKSSGMPQCKFQNLWINVNGKGAYHTLHNHQDSLLSGIFYIDIPDENMGNLRFHRGDDAQYYIPDNLSEYNMITSTMATYPPKNGLVLIFPGWAKHEVTQNQSDKERIAVSFNYGVK